MQKLLINRIHFAFIDKSPIFLVVRASQDFSLCKNKIKWLKNNLPESSKSGFENWLVEKELADEKISLVTEFRVDRVDEPDCFTAELKDAALTAFKNEIFKYEFGSHLQSKGLFVRPIMMALSWGFSAYERTYQFNNDYDVFRRVDFSWNSKRNELSFNFGSEKTLISRQLKKLKDNELSFDSNSLLVSKKHEEINSLTICPKEERLRLLGAPNKFDYKNRYESLMSFASSVVYEFKSPFFTVGKTGFKNIDPDSFNFVYSQQKLMVFGGNKTAVNAVIGMREYGPLLKAKNAENKRILFIYQNRNDANSLYRYLKNGQKHFPGLLSYVGIPVALAEPVKGFAYNDPTTLPEELEGFLGEFFADELYPDTLAIIIGPFNKYESGEEESETYFKIKKILLDKGIASQFVSPKTINSYGVHFSLPNIAIAILAKLGGIPWKLSSKKTSELIVGFNTKLVEGERYLGSAVFFDNEGRLGGVKALPINSKKAIVRSLKEAITDYANKVGTPQRLVIHYYKPPRHDEINNILELLEDMGLEMPIAVVEVNDSKAKLDVCFDANFNMGMPESGLFVKIGYNEYLLFNNNRYQKNPPRKIEDELPIKLKLRYVNTGGFSTGELIAQVYEFSRLNWKGLKQRSVPVTTSYAKTIAEFSSHFEGEIPNNQVANNIPWFI